MEYDPITGIPSEFNEYLPKDCPEYQKWTASKQDGGAEGIEKDMAKLKVEESEQASSSKKGKEQHSTFLSGMAISSGLLL